jgi:hypothetical protein
MIQHRTRAASIIAYLWKSMRADPFVGQDFICEIIVPARRNPFS